MEKKELSTQAFWLIQTDRREACLHACLIKCHIKCITFKLITLQQNAEIQQQMSL